MSDRSNLAWWEPDNAKALPDALRRQEQGLSNTRFLDGIITRLHYNQGTVGNLAVSSLSAARASVPTPFIRSLEALTQANVLRAVIETAAAMICRDPDFRVQTAGATWAIQRSARKLSQWASGVARKNKLAETAYQVFVDGCTNRIGGAKVFIEGGKMRIERVRPDCLIYADHQGLYSRDLGIRDGVPRSRVPALWPKDAYGEPVTKERLKSAKQYEPDPLYLVSWVNPWLDVDLVEYFEGWHCSSGPGDPGRHVVCIGDIVLVDEEWKHDFPGVVTYRWANSYSGFGGVPLGEQLIPYQLQLQRMDRTITEAISKLAIGRVWLKRAGIAPVMTDRPAEVVYYGAAEGPPIMQPGQAIGKEYYDRRAVLRSEAFELAGVSMSQATGEKAPGLNSGVALREDNERSYNRLIAQALGLDRFYEGIAYAQIALADDAFGKGGYKVAAQYGKLWTQIDWKDIDIGKMGEFEIQARTIRSLPNHPSARAEMIQEWIKLGAVQPNRVLKLMGARDLEAIEDNASTPEELAQRQIAAAIDDGKWIAPEPYQGAALDILVTEGQNEYLKAIDPDYKAPRKNLELLRRLIETARKMSKPAAPALPPMPQPAPGLPPDGTMPGAPSPEMQVAA